MSDPVLEANEVRLLANVILDLESLLSKLAPVRIAVSGGVDSMTLAILAGRVLGTKSTVIHAVSPAVPTEATERVRQVSRSEGWTLHVIDSGEFTDESYLANPYNRCFHCKTNLYQSITTLAQGTILSGANLDDLGDYRPGLRAASDYGVLHPFVACHVDKRTVRALCHHLGYPDIARLPAAPCLSSRMETGLRIEAGALAFIHQIEREITEAFRPKTVRCRIRRESVVVELDPGTLGVLLNGDGSAWQSHITVLARKLGLPDAVRFEPYQRGSAFVENH